jgi:hypothetical protein
MEIKKLPKKLIANLKNLEVYELIDNLQNSSDWEVVKWSSRLLGHMESEKIKLGIPTLTSLIKSSNVRTRTKVVATLGKIPLENMGSYSGEIILSMIEIISDKSNHWSVRKNTLKALGRIGAKEAIPDLLELLHHSHFKVRAHASEALCRIGHISIVDVIIPMLQDSSAFVRSRTAHALGKIGCKDADIYLISLLKDPDNNVREDAKWALSKINTPDARRALRYGTEN